MHRGVLDVLPISTTNYPNNRADEPKPKVTFAFGRIETKRHTLPRFGMSSPIVPRKPAERLAYIDVLDLFLSIMP